MAIRPIKRIKRKYKKRKYKIGSSKIEKEFGEFIQKNGIELQEQYQINYKFYDFIIKGTNILLEFNGDYFHTNPEIYQNGPINKMQLKNKKNDSYKKILAEANGYKIIYVWEKDYNESKEKVFNYIIYKIKEYLNIK